MRLSHAQIEDIRQAVLLTAGPQARVHLFGSRANDSARGGDVDLLVEIPVPVERPAMLAAQLSARISRALHGRSVDVVLSAPNLQTRSIHRQALSEGVLL